MEQLRLTRIELDKRCITHVRIAKGTRPDLKLIDLEDRVVALKDYHNSDPLFRKIVGPLLIRREKGALLKLSGVEGVPQLLHALDNHALIIEYVAGIPLNKVRINTLSTDFYDQLESLIDRMHAAGVAHADLRTGGNILVGEDGRPYLIDFASCVFRGRGLNPFTNFLFSEFRKADKFAVLWVKRKFSPALLTADEESRLSRVSPLERPAIFIGKTVRKLTRRTLTKS